MAARTSVDAAAELAALETRCGEVQQDIEQQKEDAKQEEEYVEHLKKQLQTVAPEEEEAVKQELAMARQLLLSSEQLLTTLQQRLTTLEQQTAIVRQERLVLSQQEAAAARHAAGRGTGCGAGKIQYTEISALDISNKLIIFRDKPCIITPTKPINTKPWTSGQVLQRFGRCGVAPTFARVLPTTICGSTSGSPGNTDRGADGSHPVKDPPPTGATPGVPGPVLPRTAVKEGEQVPSGVSRIEADASGVGDVSAAKQPVVVGVIDSGVSANHPDINYIGGSTWATASTKVAGDTADAGVDLYGHGTHVAGIIGAKNNGQGVIGVAPDVPIYSLKVLDAEGRGTLSDAIAATQWAAGPEGQAKNIGVINLSLASYIDPSSPDYASTLSSICRVFTEASEAGIFIAVSAGNYGTSLLGYLPASCPTVAVVASIDPASNSPAPYSNWLPVDAPAADKARVIAAPGSNILSTLPFSKDPSGYRELSGTSMASPHIAGIAATCIMSGACPAASSCLEKLAVLQAVAREKLDTTPAYNAKSLTDGSKYYGLLAWAKF